MLLFLVWCKQWAKFDLLDFWHKHTNTRFIHVLCVFLSPPFVIPPLLICMLYCYTSEHTEYRWTFERSFTLVAIYTCSRCILLDIDQVKIEAETVDDDDERFLGDWHDFQSKHLQSIFVGWRKRSAGSLWWTGDRQGTAYIKFLPVFNRTGSYVLRAVVRCHTTTCSFHVSYGLSRAPVEHASNKRSRHRGLVSITIYWSM